jgi:hypothetical protein
MCCGISDDVELAVARQVDVARTGGINLELAVVACQSDCLRPFTVVDAETLGAVEVVGPYNMVTSLGSRQRRLPRRGIWQGGR